MWSRFSYFPSISSSNGHFNFQRRGKIIKLCLNPSKGEYFSNIFLWVIDNSNWVNFWENNYLGTPKGFRDIQTQPLESNLWKSGVPFNLGVKLFYAKFTQLFWKTYPRNIVALCQPPSVFQFFGAILRWYPVPLGSGCTTGVEVKANVP